MALLLQLLLILASRLLITNCKQPNIVFILADDLGYNDVGYHSQYIHTPTINNLTANGVQLEQYYTQQSCSPSRASLMTGRYPIHIGFNKVFSINVQDEFGLSLNFTLLPEKLKSLGYATHAIGKWHLGYYNPKYLPTSRGFDTHFGFYGADLHYFTHTTYDLFSQPTPPDWCCDLHNNSECVTNLNGTYTLDIFTKEARRLIDNHDAGIPMFMYFAVQNVHNPIEVPDKYEHLYYHVRNSDRRKVLGMITALDDAIAGIVESLKLKGDEFWNNTIIIFASDNGGWTIPDGQGSNHPLRAGKVTLFEGGIRVPAFVHSPLIKNPKRVESSLFHVSDWFPTLVNLAGGSLSAEQGLDGFDQWDLISNGVSSSAYSPRFEILHNLMPNDWGYLTGALRIQKWKILTGRWANCSIESYPYYCFWFPPPEQNTGYYVSSDDSLFTGSHPPPNKVAYITKSKSYKTTKYDPIMLFNIEDDPYERYDVKDSYPNIVDLLINRLDYYLATIVPGGRMPRNKKGWEEAAKKAGCFAPWVFDED